MTSAASTRVRLTPELQAEYQQIYNDPARKGSPEWAVAAKGLHAAGVITVDPENAADLEAAIDQSEASTIEQSL